MGIRGVSEVKGIRVLRWEKPAPVTQEEAEARLHQEGYDCYSWYDVSGTSYPNHKHSEDECLWILKGELRITVHQTEHILREGDRVYLPASLPHSAYVPDRNGVTYLVGQKRP